MTANVPLERHGDALTLCTFCPSLCRDACPVATESARDTASPWGLMSLARHVVQGRLRLTTDVARSFYHCTGCRGCTTICKHGVEVADVLVAARRFAVARGRAPLPADAFAHADGDGRWGAAADGPSGRFEPQPSVLLLPGHASLFEASEPVTHMLELCRRLDEDELTLGESSRLDVGCDLWAAGYHDDFANRARRVRDALAGASHVVVMSAVALHTLRDVYPRVGAPIEAQLLHASEFLLPFLGGAVVERVPGRVAYHDSCHLARHLGMIDVPREVLRRVLVEPVVELPYRQDRTWCCGGTGCLPQASPKTSLTMARAVVDDAIAEGAERLVTFAPECLAMLREAAGADLTVEAATSLVARAVRGDGAV